MSNRCLALVVLLAPAIASAGGLSFDVSAGGGAGIMYSDPCGGPFVPAHYTTPAIRLHGPSAEMRGMVGARYQLRGRFGLRWGAGLRGSAMTDSGDTGTIISTGGEFGVTFDRWSADFFEGLSYVRIRTDNMIASGATIAIGGAIGFAITPQVLVYVRGDVSAIADGPIGGVSAGAGIGFRL